MAMLTLLEVAHSFQIQDLALLEASSAVRKMMETDVAAGPTSVMVVGIHSMDDGTSGSQNIRWGIRKKISGAWESDFVAGDILNSLDPDDEDLWHLAWVTDPSVAYNPATGQYVCVSLGRLEPQPGGGALGYGILANTYSEGSGWSKWKVIYHAPLSIPFVGLSADKPFIVTGEPNEFYVTWWNTPLHIDPDYWGTLGFARSTDGGATWVTGKAADQSGQDLACSTSQPSVYSNGALFVAYDNGGVHTGNIRFLKGTDNANGGVDFEILMRSPTRPLNLFVEAVQANDLPGVLKIAYIPQIAVDPTNADTFYIALQTLPNSISQNSDVVFVKASFDGAVWGFSPRKTMPDPLPPLPPDPPPPVVDDHTDQFLPVLSVDSNGTIHAIYYSDHRFYQVDSEDDAQYELMYATSTDGGQSFTSDVIVSGFAEPWMDFGLPNGPPGNWPGPLEYNGMYFVDLGAGGVDVWASASGTHSSSAEKTVFYSFRID